MVHTVDATQLGDMVIGRWTLTGTVAAPLSVVDANLTVEHLRGHAAP